MAMLMSPGDDDHNRAIRGAALWSWGHGEGPIQEGLGSLDRPSGGGDPYAIRRGGAVAITSGRFRAVLL